MSRLLLALDRNAFKYDLESNMMANESEADAIARLYAGHGPYASYGCFYYTHMPTLVCYDIRPGFCKLIHLDRNRIFSLVLEAYRFALSKNTTSLERGALRMFLANCKKLYGWTKFNDGDEFYFYVVEW